MFSCEQQRVSISKGVVKDTSGQKRGCLIDIRAWTPTQIMTTLRQPKVINQPEFQYDYDMSNRFGQACLP